MNPRTVTDAIVDRLDAELTQPVTVGERQADPPAVIVHPLPGGTLPGLLSDLHRSGTLPYQVTCVGKGREQAEWLAEQTVAALDDFTHADSGIRLVHLVAWPGVRLDADDPPGVWIATPSFHVTVDQEPT